MTVNTLASLKLTTAKKPRSLPAIVKKRAKLLQKLGEQRELALAQVEDRNYVPKRLRTVRDISTESPRVLRRLQTLRKLSHEQEIKSFFTGDARARYSDGAGASR